MLGKSASRVAACTNRSIKPIHARDEHTHLEALPVHVLVPASGIGIVAALLVVLLGVGPRKIGRQPPLRVQRPPLPMPSNRPQVLDLNSRRRKMSEEAQASEGHREVHTYHEGRPAQNDHFAGRHGDGPESDRAPIKSNPQHDAFPRQVERERPTMAAAVEDRSQPLDEGYRSVRKLSTRQPLRQRVALPQAAGDRCP